MRRAGIVVALALFLACSRNSIPESSLSSQPNATTSADLTPEELDILEAVFRFQIGRGAPDTYPKRFLLSLSGGKGPWKDPPAEFLARFRENVPSVEPISAAGPRVGVGVHEGGPPGIILKLAEFRRLDRDTAEVYGDYYSHLRASADTYLVERRAGAWVVVKDGMRGVY